MVKTVKVRRANVVLTVPEEQRGEYLSKGFDVLDSNGNIAEHTVPSDMNTLKTAYTNHIKRIEALETENKKLKSELRIAKKKAKEADN